jgi:Domain of unknown function (DUF4158)
MSTPGTTTPHAASGGGHRTPSILLPEDPSLEELAQCWTLSARDKEEVMRCRGDANRRRFAVQLCTLRNYGRFLPEAIAAPVAITNYLAQQLNLPPMLVGAVPGRLATERGMFGIRVKTGHKNTAENVRPGKTITCMVGQVGFHSPRSSIRAEAGGRKRFCQAVVQQAVFAGIMCNRSSVREGPRFWTNLPVAGNYPYPELTPTSSLVPHGRLELLNR